MSYIHFTINYEVKNKQKFVKFIDTFNNDINYEIRNLEIEKYWKIKGQYQANFIIEFNNNKEIQELVYEVISLTNKLASLNDNYLKYFDGPFEESQIAFECTLKLKEQIKLPLTWAHIKLVMW